MDYKARVNIELIRSEGKIYNEHANGSKIYTGEYTFNYSGSLEGRGEYVEIKNYSENGDVIIMGMERITGNLGEKNGSFVLEHRGIIKEGVITSHRIVVYGSGTDELAGIRGEVKFESDQPKSFFIFNYSLD